MKDETDSKTSNRINKTLTNLSKFWLFKIKL